MKCLIIKKRWLDLILSGQKTLEIRGRNTNIRGWIGLIESGSGKIVGKAKLNASSKLSEDEYYKLTEFHRVTLNYNKLPYKTPYAWGITQAERLQNPIPYKHPKGAIIWVNINNLNL